MIIDIDDKESVSYVVNNLTKQWFDIKKLYAALEDNGSTISPSFWGITDDLLNVVSNTLNLKCDDFLAEWNNKLSINQVKIMGYHCTRQRDKDMFRDQGIVPLSDKAIEEFMAEFQIAFPSLDLSKKQYIEILNSISQSDSWRHRSGQGLGPYFLLSYKTATDINNNFFLKRGPEIWQYFIDNTLKYLKSNSISFDYCTRNECNQILLRNATPLIIHCAVPYDILPDSKYYIYCILRAYFNFINPESEDNLFNGYSIDLKGNILEPIYILKIEELNIAA